jgi:hypothetical protein
MKAFLKENFVLALGISLPVLLIITVVIAQQLSLPSAPPQYKAIFAVQNQYYNHKPYKFEVDENGKLSVSYKEPEPHPNQNNYHYNHKANIYIYDPALNYARAIKFDAPEGLKTGEIKVFETTELDKYRLNTSELSPDGYFFTKHNRRSGGNLFTDVFGYRSTYSRYALKKENHIVSIKIDDYFYGQEKFIGWVIEEEK